MFLCESCHEKGTCRFSHLFHSAGACEQCSERSHCMECHGERVELAPVTAEEIRSNLLCHLNELAKMAVSCGPVMRRLADQVECATHMCRLAGVPELEISRAQDFIARRMSPEEIRSMAERNERP